MSEAKEIERIKKRYTKEQLLTEAETVEEYGEWEHMDLMGYGPEELREIAEGM